MSRPPRVEVPNGIYHVVARGNERQIVFRDDHDRDRFLEILAGVCARYGWITLCFCLMGNHYHVLVKTPELNLARGMRQLNGVYAQWFNRRHARIGHLFQGRYNAVLIQADRHLWNAVQYIVRNPVRAGLTENVDDWHWTSHAQTIGTRRPGVVAVAELLSHFGADTRSARRAYLELVRTADDAPGRRHAILDGDEQFVETHLALLRTSPEHPHASTVRAPPPLDVLVGSRNDDAAIYVANTQHRYSLRAIANHLGCGVTTIHRRVKAHETARGGTREPADGTWKT